LPACPPQYFLTSPARGGQKYNAPRITFFLQRSAFLSDRFGYNMGPPRRFCNRIVEHNFMVEKNSRGRGGPNKK
jgi:hypothetical protein